MIRLRFLAVAILPLLVSGCIEHSDGAETTTPSLSSSAESAAPHSAEAPLEAGDVAASIATVAPDTASGALQERTGTNQGLETGQENAPVALTVYTNHSCRYCAEFTRNHLERLLTDFVAPGLLKIEIIPFPLQKYPSSDLEAKTLLCATEQGRGLAMHRALFSLNPRTEAAILTMAKEQALDAKALAGCLKSDRLQEKLNVQKAQAVLHGVSFVPAFSIDGQTKTGLPDYPDLRGWIQEELEQAGNRN